MEVFQELDVLLMLGGRAQLHQLISEGVVNPAVSQEVHQVVIQSLKKTKVKRLKCSSVNHSYHLIY